MKSLLIPLLLSSMALAGNAQAESAEEVNALSPYHSKVIENLEEIYSNGDIVASATAIEAATAANPSIASRIKQSALNAGLAQQLVEPAIAGGKVDSQALSTAMQMAVAADPQLAEQLHQFAINMGADPILVEVAITNGLQDAAATAAGPDKGEIK